MLNKNCSGVSRTRANRVPYQNIYIGKNTPNSIYPFIDKVLKFIVKFICS